MKDKPSRWYGLALVGLLIAVLSWSEWVAIASLLRHWEERHAIKLDRLILAFFQGACLVLLALGVVNHFKRRGRIE